MNTRAWLTVGALVALPACTQSRGTATAEPCPTCSVVDHSAHGAHHASAPAATPGGSLGVLGARVAAARPFARIVVPPGVYREPTIVIDKPLTLVGEAGAILDGEGVRSLLLITADDVTVTGFTIRNTGDSQVDERAGIRAANARRCVIEENTFDNTAFGVYLEKTSGCVVRGNVLRGSGKVQMQTGNGIHAWSSDSVSVLGNDIAGHRDGIYFEFVRNGAIDRNVSHENARYGLHFMFSDDCRYQDNTFRENGNGVAVMYSKHVQMTGNSFAHNYGGAAYGLLLKDINESAVTGNRFTANTVAVHMEGANRNHLRGNTFTGNGIALRILANAQDNVIVENDFSTNTFDVATNSRASYSTLRGNSWDRYRGYDLDRNGIGDVPHVPVTLFGLVVEQSPAALVLLRSPFVGLLDIAERAIPVLTSSALRDEAPRLVTRRGT